MFTINMEIEEKTDYTLSVTYRDDTTNLPVNLSGYKANLQIRGMFGSPYVLIDLNETNGITLGGPSGNIDIKIKASDTDKSLDSNPWTRAAYDLILTNTQNERIKLLKGFVTVIRSSTI